MKVSSLIGFFISTCLLVFLVAADTSEDIMDITYENIIAGTERIPPAALGFVVYSADTGNLLFTTSLAADDPEIMQEIGGAGNYIVIRTQDRNWCTSLSLHECRKNTYFVSESAISIQAIVPDILPEISESEDIADVVMPIESLPLEITESHELVTSLPVSTELEPGVLEMDIESAPDMQHEVVEEKKEDDVVAETGAELGTESAPIGAVVNTAPEPLENVLEEISEIPGVTPVLSENDSSEQISDDQPL